QAMVQAERLAAVGQTIAALSHHIKNILQSLRSGSEILRMGIATKDEPLLQQGWKLAEKAQGKIYHLVTDMLSYSKEREPAVEPTDLNALAREVMELEEPRVKELGIKLEANFEENLPPVPVDPEGIQHLRHNPAPRPSGPRGPPPAPPKRARHRRGRRGGPPHRQSPRRPPPRPRGGMGKAAGPGQRRRHPAPESRRDLQALCQLQGRPGDG